MIFKIRGGLLAACALAASSSLFAQEIDPVDVYQDPNGIDLVSNNVSTPQMPELSIPAAPELTFRDLADFVPLMEIVTGDSPGNGFEPNIYFVSAGRVASDQFAVCSDEICYASNGTGGMLFNAEGGNDGPNIDPICPDPAFCPPPEVEPNPPEAGDVLGLGGVTYRAGSTGLTMTFHVQTGRASGTLPQPIKKYLATEIFAPGGADLSFEYESEWIGGIEYHRPTTVTSTSGYQLRFTYFSNSAVLNWGALQKAEIVEATNPNVALASLTYAGNTATDIAGRIYECVCMPDIYPTLPQNRGSRMKLPGQSDYAFETFRQQGSNTRTVTADGVTYTYVSPPDNTWVVSPGFPGSNGPIHDITITGPDGFNQFIDVTNIQATTGPHDPPRRRIDSVTDSLGRTTNYQYNGAQQLTGVTYPEGNSVSMDYDIRGNLTSRTDTPKPGSSLPPITQTALYPSSQCGLAGFNCYRPTWIQDGNGNRTDFTWNTWGLIETQLDPADQNGKRRKTKNTWSGLAAINGETCPEFLQLGLPGGPPRCKPRLLKEEICETDVNGNELTCGTSASFVREFTYFKGTSLPLTETVTDGAGGASLTTTFTYDAAGRQLSVDTPNTGSDDTFYTRYDSLGREVGTIAPDPDGTGSLGRLATRTTYDLRGNVIKVETGELQSLQPENIAPANWGSDFDDHIQTTTETTYDAYNRKLTDRVKGSDGVTVSLTQYSYDNRGRLQCTAVRMNPAAYGSLPSSACALGVEGSHGLDRITKTVYDAAGQVVQVWRAYGTPDQISKVEYSYTANGQIENVVDANGNRAHYKYDGHDRQSRWIFPSKSAPTSYDPAAGGLSTSGTPNWSDYEEYTYDNNGNRTSLRKRDGSVISYQYDALNRMTRKIVPGRSGLASLHTRDVFYDYDLRGLPLRTRFDSLNGPGQLNTYDGFGRLTEAQDTTLGAGRSIFHQYDKNGNRTRVDYPEGHYWQYSYDRLNRLKDISYKTENLGGFSYNQRGLRSSLSWTAATLQANQSLWSYDSAGRLDGIDININGTHRDVSWDYTRNPASQIRTETQSNDSYSWDGHVNLSRNYVTNGLNQYESAGGASFCYDANGNLTADGSSVFLYDVENRLVEKRVQTNTNCAALSYSGAMQAILRYDPLGRLYWVDGGGYGTTYFLYDGNALAVALDGSGVIRDVYAHGSNAEADDPLVWIHRRADWSWHRHHLHADPRGSIVAVTNWRGDTYATNTYDEFGIPDTASGDDTGTKGRFRYTGQMWIPELEMYYYKARIYSYKLGRFLQTDPIGYEDQFNLYAYVANDPINGTDPTGMQTSRDMVQEAWIADMRAQGMSEQQIQQAVFDSAALEGAALSLFLPGPEDIALAGALATKAGQAIKGLFTSRKAAKACCFVAGTLVDTEDGLRSIEEIEVGDLVWARDEETGETALKAVTDLIRRHERVIWEVKLIGLDGEIATFETTDDHPWWIAGQGWKRTEELIAGMAVVTRDGRGMVVASVEETERTDATYNLTVADFETYFVGRQRVLVHNCPPGSYTNHHKSGKTYDGKGDASRAAKSGREKAKEHNDPLVKSETRKASSDRESFKQESRSLDRNGGPKSDRNYNKIESPGKRMRREDGEID